MSLYLGLTGNIASGKSTAANFFRELGCYTIDADEISRIVMKKGGIAYEAIVEKFGNQILNEDNEIDRGKLKNIVFNDKRKLKLLEEIVHPAIRSYERKIVSDIKSKDSKAIILTQAALIIEKRSFERFDGIIVVYANEDVILKRLLKRDNIDKNFALKILENQMSYDEKTRYANFIINNSYDLENLKNEVKRIFEVLNIHLYAKKQLKKNGIVTDYKFL